MASSPLAMPSVPSKLAKEARHASSKFTKIGGYTLVLMIFIFVALGSFNYWSNAHPPAHELFYAKIEPPVVHKSPEGNLDIVIKTSSLRRETCPATIYRTFFNAADGAIVYSTMSVGGTVPASGKVTEVPFPIRLPVEKFPPGEYGYTSFAINTCEDGRVVVAGTGIVKFQIAR